MAGLPSGAVTFLFTDVEGFESRVDPTAKGCVGPSGLPADT
jgi:hypothetical protein